MQNAIASLGLAFSDAKSLEIGTGWFPTMLIMLSVRGAHRILLAELNPHSNEVTFVATLGTFSATASLVSVRD